MYEDYMQIGKTALIVVIVALIAIPTGIYVTKSVTRYTARVAAERASERAAKQKAEKKAKALAAKLQPPYWTAENIVGTKWTGKFNKVEATISIDAGGVVTAKSDSAIVKFVVPNGELKGTWSINGNKITIEATAPGFGKQTLTGTISGKQFLDDGGVPLPLKQIQ